MRPTGLRAEFKGMDPDNSGTITRAELKAGLTKCAGENANFSDEQVGARWRRVEIM